MRVRSKNRFSASSSSFVTSLTSLRSCATSSPTDASLTTFTLTTSPISPPTNGSFAVFMLVVLHRHSWLAWFTRHTTKYSFFFATITPSVFWPFVRPSMQSLMRRLRWRFCGSAVAITSAFSVTSRSCSEVFTSRMRAVTSLPSLHSTPFVWNSPCAKPMRPLSSSTITPYGRIVLMWPFTALPREMVRQSRLGISSSLASSTSMSLSGTSSFISSLVSLASSFSPPPW